MPTAAFTIPVAAPVDVVWRLLSEAATVPQRFDDTVEAVTILEAGDGHVRRRVVRRGMTQVEAVKIYPKARKVSAQLVDNAHYAGSLVLQAEAANPTSSGHGQVRVHGKLDWTPRMGSETAEDAAAWTAAVERQLRSLKEQAETRAIATGAV